MYYFTKTLDESLAIKMRDRKSQLLDRYVLP